MRIRMLSVVMCASMAVAAIGCRENDAESEATVDRPIEVASPGGAPGYGSPSGMGFPVGDAIHSVGQGSGLSSYHGTGAAGTSGTITDTHQDPDQALPGAAEHPVLPPA